MVLWTRLMVIVPYLDYIEPEGLPCYGTDLSGRVKN